MKSIIKSIIFLFLVIPFLAHAQSSSLWKLNSGVLLPVNPVYQLDIPSLGTTGNPCVTVNNSGLFSTQSCGSGGTPAGSNGDIQYNEGGAFSAGGLNWDPGALVFLVNGTENIMGDLDVNNIFSSSISNSGSYSDYLNNTGSNGNVLISTGTTTYWVATSSLGISSSPAGFNGQLQYNKNGSFGATSSPVVEYITATSTTATSTFAGAINLISSTLDPLANPLNAGLYPLVLQNQSIGIGSSTGLGFAVTTSPLSINGMGAAILFKRTAAGSVGELQFLNNQVVGNPLSESMVIASNGNVGIGTTTPFATLSVQQPNTFMTDGEPGLAFYGSTPTFIGGGGGGAVIVGGTGGHFVGSAKGGNGGSTIITGGNGGLGGGNGGNGGSLILTSGNGASGNNNMSGGTNGSAGNIFLNLGISGGTGGMNGQVVIGTTTATTSNVSEYNIGTTTSPCFSNDGTTCIGGTSFSTNPFQATYFIATSSSAISYFANATTTNATTTNLSISGHLYDGSNSNGLKGQCLLATATSTVWSLCPAIGNLTYYLNDATSTLGYHLQLTTLQSNQTSSTTVVSVPSGTTTVAVLANFITSPNVPNLTTIPAGTYEFHIHAAQTSGTKIGSLYGVIYDVNSSGSIVQTIGTTESTDDYGGITTSNTGYDLDYYDVNPVTLGSTTDRILTRIYDSFSGTGGTSATVVLYWGDSSDSHTSLPSNTIDATNFVPYTGAVQTVNLGSQNLITTGTTTSPCFSNNGTTCIGGTSFSTNPFHPVHAHPL